MAENDRNLFSHGLVGKSLRSKSRQVGPFQWPCGRICSMSLYLLLMVASNPWSSLVCISPVCFCLHRTFYPVSVPVSKFPSSYGTGRIRFRAHPYAIWPRLQLIIPTKTKSVGKVTFIDSRWIWILGDSIQLSTEDSQESGSSVNESGVTLIYLSSHRSFSVVALKSSGAPLRLRGLRSSRSPITKYLCAKLRNLNFLMKCVGATEGF